FLYYLLIVYVLRTFDSIYISNEGLLDSLLYSGIITYIMLFITLFTVYTGISYIMENWTLIKKLFNEQN
ncbi:MAG: CDP-diacylglycerol--glycerol-3-phosphate 3-phosphatidyltransferase, partial [Ignavibacteria bacterium]|nr:CDP-diacylglycerol--glycerol-3-phosphate 3-phosphatidyltransferase [Ignavibacteria bacterium]